MRVTQNMLSNTMMYNLNNSLSKMDRLQDMLATGKKISKPSQDPVVAVRGMFYRTSLMENEQFRRNTDEGVNWMDSSESAINESRDVLSRVKELMTQASSDTLDTTDREKIREELIQLRDHLGAVANTTAGGLYLFGGTDTLTAPYGEVKPGTPTPAGGQYDTLTYAPTVGYTNQNNASIDLEMSQSIYLSINVDGVQLFGQQKSGNIPDAPIMNITDPTKPEQLENQKNYNDAWKADLFGLMDKMINDLKPSPNATDRYGRLLAADSKGNPLYDPSTGQAILYDKNDPTHQILKKHNYITNDKGQLLAADAQGNPIPDPADPTNPTKTKLFQPNSTDYVLTSSEDAARPKSGKELTGYLTVIQSHTDNFLQVQAAVGARMNRIQMIQDRLDTQHDGTEKIMSDGEDADLAKVITDLQNQENVHRAALASGSRIIQPTLLDFLR
ncbi:flagellar hook-associated protein FlgL [Aneurinibacillus tyrosinisolvens]|uniref:flagellar hook-associated protein FlgL n=1 Tax=Aneurinibacillus tyrosinisolvens TaxID=1443435 RepID=UPI0006999B46|nr:flagellar hook-associated protein FlgL [Aneurinibacillus tyrosinisolvens]